MVHKITLCSIILSIGENEMADESALNNSSL